jgi:hypothetical protein
MSKKCTMREECSKGSSERGLEETSSNTNHLEMPPTAVRRGR